MTEQILKLYRGSAGTQLDGRMPSVTCTISPALPFVLLDPEQTHSTRTQKLNGDIVCLGIIRSVREALDAVAGLPLDEPLYVLTNYSALWPAKAELEKMGERL